MTILREIWASRGEGRERDFKIVYVAPMKALAAEMVRNFSAKLGRITELGVRLRVRELTGDMQLTPRELRETQVLVTTPEKWDVVTRKATDTSVSSLVRLLIIDEVHLLHEERGAVLETLVARTLRLAESTQSPIRIVGLSATLPNYLDVAHFLRVRPATGLIHRGAEARPVPLETRYIGVKSSNEFALKRAQTDVAFDKVVASLRGGHQVLVFVHSRKDTYGTARTFVELATARGLTDLLLPADPGLRTKRATAERTGPISRSRNKQLREVFAAGLLIHHAGMLREDRTASERLFRDGLARVLVCTATLAWGVNLPAHTVVIKGTKVYNSGKGKFVELGMLDVQQIFGRAGRPQYDTTGEGIIITGLPELPHYLALLTNQLPIESRFQERIADHLNAEVVLGTVSNLNEAVQWLSYTYLYTRMLKNPLMYGITWQELQQDPQLVAKRLELVVAAAKTLHNCQLIRFNPDVGLLAPTDSGRIASHFYIRHETFEEPFATANLSPLMSDADIFRALCDASEFEQITVRDDELKELDRLQADACVIPVDAVENSRGKVSCLLQAHISRSRLDTFSLVSDAAYVAQNGARLLRALFELAVRRGWPTLAERVMRFALSLDHRVWHFQHPLRQLGHRYCSDDMAYRLERAGRTTASIESLRDLSTGELASLLRTNNAAASALAATAASFPSVELEAQLHPVTPTIVRITVTLRATQRGWNAAMLGGSSSLPYWLWVSDPESERMHHVEQVYLSAKARSVDLTFVVPIGRPLPSQYLITAQSTRFLHASSTIGVPFDSVLLPRAGGAGPTLTPLLDLVPLPKSALAWPDLEAAYPWSHFNPMQTQVFHTLRHCDTSVLLGAPTGAGKTVAAEIAMARVFRSVPEGTTPGKIVYVGPLKALVRERRAGWTKLFGAQLGKPVVELTGDAAPDARALRGASIIVTTPEKFDCVSRQWRDRAFVRQISLVIFDEVHLLGAEGTRGAVLEGLVARLRNVCPTVRFVALSTALANPSDVADWLGVDAYTGIYNFSPAVRPVPLEAHIQGFPGRAYCPRMATMNKPCFEAIMTHAPAAPTLIFVASRRQTRLTAMDLVGFLARSDAPRQFVGDASDHELAEETLASSISDDHVRHALGYGIGMHHAGLPESDRQIVERLFAEGHIRVLVSTSTLAWGVNLPAHLVIVKGTEYFDGRAGRYVDFPVTDVLQMMGRAGRVQFDTSAVAVIMVAEAKKNFYKKFLYEPFPLESSLPDILCDLLNAEVVAGTIQSEEHALRYLTWTFFYRRLVQNPSYYGCTMPVEAVRQQRMYLDLAPAHTSAAAKAEKALRVKERAAIRRHLETMVRDASSALAESGCVDVSPDGSLYAPTDTGRIACLYYLSHLTLRRFSADLTPDTAFPDVLRLVSQAEEFAELPVRHSEDETNARLDKDSTTTRHRISTWTTPDDPHAKASLLLQLHLSRGTPPVSDYRLDLKSVLDQSMRVARALVEVAALRGWLQPTLAGIALMQAMKQAAWPDAGAARSPGARWMPRSVRIERDGRRRVRLTVPQGAPTVEHAPAFPKDPGPLRYFLVLVDTTASSVVELASVRLNSWHTWATQLDQEEEDNESRPLTLYARPDSAIGYDLVEEGL
jgi:activating signal cointegrator complex subunit 3